MVNEAVTRREQIDPRLKAAGWRVVPLTEASGEVPSSPTAVEEWPTANGPADYSLCHLGSIRGVVEARKPTMGPQGVLTQAERYSKGVAQVPMYRGEYGVPFLYSTNGELIYFHDVRRELNRSRQIAAFHTAWPSSRAHRSRPVRLPAHRPRWGCRNGAARAVGTRLGRRTHRSPGRPPVPDAY